jgi:hypothetical protein
MKVRRLVPVAFTFFRSSCVLLRHEPSRVLSFPRFLIGSFRHTPRRSFLVSFVFLVGFGFLYLIMKVRRLVPVAFTFFRSSCVLLRHEPSGVLSFPRFLIGSFRHTPRRSFFGFLCFSSWFWFGVSRGGECLVSFACFDGLLCFLVGLLRRKSICSGRGRRFPCASPLSDKGGV